MKQLKKISLQKEELVSLNSPQMDSIKGGTSPLTSSWPCAAASAEVSSEMCSIASAIVVDYTYHLTVDIYNYVDDYFNGWYGGPDYYTELTEVIVTPESVITP